MSNWIAPGSGTWTDPDNWSAGVPSGIDAIANFNFSFDTNLALVEIPDFSTITLTDLNVSLSGTGSLRINGALADSGTGSGTLIFNGGAGAARVNVSNSASTGTFEISGLHGLVVQLATDTVFSVFDPGGRAIISASISGSGILAKNGDGTLELTGNNTFTGRLALLGGILEASGNSALGSGQISFGNNAGFRSVGSINKEFVTVTASPGTAGSGQFLAATTTTMTLIGTIRHFSQGTISFGSAVDTGIIVARFTSIVDNPTSSSFRVAGGTLQFGDAFNAANLFSHVGIGLSEISSGGILDTKGFAAVISNLDLDGGTIRSSAGALNVTVNDISLATLAQAGTIEGTAGVDSLAVNVAGGFSLAGVILANWTAGIDTIALNGSAANNTLTGSTGRDIINGFAGNDTLNGNGGLDSIIGGEGDDLINLVATNAGSSVDGGTGNDTLRLGGAISLGSIAGFEFLDLVAGASLTLTGDQFAAGFAANTVFSGTGSVTVSLGAGGSFFATSMTKAGGSAVTFTIVGNTGVEVIKASLSVSNTIFGNGDVDQIRGGNLADTINGGSGNDKIMGLAGSDLLTGGTGADQFRYLFTSDSGIGILSDQILDFVANTDKLDFRTLDVDPFTAGRQALTFINSAAFSATGQAQIRWVDLGADLRVQVDLDGNGTSDMEMLLVGAGTQVLTATDFLL